MNDLVERLSKKKHKIEAARSEKTADVLKECIDRNYVHIMFKDFGTELGIKLDKKSTDLSKGDFDKKSGKVHLEGGVRLNYDCIRVVADINLKTLEGQGTVKSVTQEEYEKIINEN